MTENRTVAQLLSDYASILDELRDREIFAASIIRSATTRSHCFAMLTAGSARATLRLGTMQSIHAGYAIKLKRGVSLYELSHKNNDLLENGFYDEVLHSRSWRRI